MAQLKDTVVQGSLRVTDTTYTTDLVVSGSKTARHALIAPTSDGAPTWRALTNADVGLGNVENTKLSTWAGTSNITTLGTVTTGTWSASTIAVNKGGTGATTFTSGALLIGNGTSAIGTRTIKNMTALGDLGWTAAATDIYIPTVNTLAYWNGRYNSTTSNLTYCNKGAFGDMAIKTKGNGFSDSSNTISVAYGTSANTAVQGNQTIFTLNGSTKNSGSSASFYAPTTSGTAGYILKAGGANTAPDWIQYVPVANGGTGTSSAPTKGGIIYAASTSQYASTGIGTVGNPLVSGSANAPTWHGGVTFTGNSSSNYAASFSGTLTVEGTSTFNGTLIGKNNINYGSSLPNSGTNGQLFFQTSDLQYELPDGGGWGTFLIKATNNTRDVAWSDTVRRLTSVEGIAIADGGLLITQGGIVARNSVIEALKVQNAIWNDYAECRQSKETEPGRVITETYNGIMELASQRLMPACKVISDTYGSLMGESDTAKTPIAVAGRVLVYPYKNRESYNLGDAVCSAPGGTVDIMSREEIRDYPERIIGTVSEIPTYDTWYAGNKDNPINVSVNGRIWIYVR